MRIMRHDRPPLEQRDQLLRHILKARRVQDLIRTDPMNPLRPQIASGIDERLPPPRDRAILVHMDDRHLGHAISSLRPKPRRLKIENREPHLAHRLPPILSPLGGCASIKKTRAACSPARPQQDLANILTIFTQLQFSTVKRSRMRRVGCSDGVEGSLCLRVRGRLRSSRISTLIRSDTGTPAPPPSKFVFASKATLECSG